MTGAILLMAGAALVTEAAHRRQRQGRPVHAIALAVGVQLFLGSLILVTRGPLP